MTVEQRRLLAMALGALATLAIVALWGWVTVTLVGSELDESQRRQIGEWLAPRLPIVVLTTLVLAGGIAALVNWAWQRWVGAPARLLEQARARLTLDEPPPLQPIEGDATLRGLAPLGFSGCNVTIPHKERALSIVDHVDPVARRIGAISCVIVRPDESLAALAAAAAGR